MALFLRRALGLLLGAALIALSTAAAARTVEISGSMSDASYCGIEALDRAKDRSPGEGRTVVDMFEEVTGTCGANNASQAFKLYKAICAIEYVGMPLVSYSTSWEPGNRKATCVYSDEGDPEPPQCEAGETVGSAFQQGMSAPMGQCYGGCKFRRSPDVAFQQNGWFGYLYTGTGEACNPDDDTESPGGDGEGDGGGSEGGGSEGGGSEGGGEDGGGSDGGDGEPGEWEGPDVCGDREFLGTMNGQPVCKEKCPAGQSWGSIDGGPAQCHAVGAPGEDTSGECPAGQKKQGSINGNPVCVADCPAGQYWGTVGGETKCHGDKQGQCPKGHMWGTLNGVLGCHSGNGLGGGGSDGGSGGGTGGGGGGGGGGTKPGGGDGDGKEGSGGTSGGVCAGGAMTEPKCTPAASAVECGVFIEAWKLRCAQELEHDKVFGSEAWQAEADSVIGDSEENAVRRASVDFEPLLDEVLQRDVVTFGGSCPSPKTFNFMNRTYSLSYEPICDFAERVRPFLVTIGYVLGSLIVLGFVGRKS